MWRNYEGAGKIRRLREAADAFKLSFQRILRKARSLFVFTGII